jgi:hypothetical protein
MQGIEQLLQQAQSRKQLRDAARAAFAALNSGERRDLFAEFAEMVMADTSAQSAPMTSPASPASESVPIAQASSTAARSKIDKAEQLVMAHPGITSREVGERIDQTPSTAASTLSQLAERRGTVENRNGGWYPVPKKRGKGPSTVREAIVEAMSDGVPRGAGAVYRAISERAPEANKNSINAQVHRMVTDGLLVKHGDGEHGALYVLAASVQKTEG